MRLWLLVSSLELTPVLSKLLFETVRTDVCRSLPAEIEPKKDDLYQV